MAGQDSASPVEVEQVAISRQGEQIIASRMGDRRARTRLVVIGQIHGDEPGGRGVVAELMTRPAPEGVAIWLIDTANPDGAARQRRVNARGVDLNRNFPDAWRRQGAGTRLWSGPSAGSEPETRGLMGFLGRVRPDAVLVFHQDFAVVDTTHPRSARAGWRLARWLGLPARPVGCPGPCSGTLTGWVDSRLRTVALTVELPGTEQVPDVDRAADAVLSLARWLAD